MILCLNELRCVGNEALNNKLAQDTLSIEQSSMYAPPRIPIYA